MNRSHLHLLLTAGLSLALVTISGCADRAPTDATKPAIVTQPIINGFAPNAPHHDATVALLQRSSSSTYPDIFCSGTLVTPEVIVTAAHCLTTQRGKKWVTTSPDKIAIYFGDDTYNDPNGVTYAAVETLVYPSYDPRAITDDIALVRISPPMTDIAPVPVLPHALGFSSADIGETLNFAGFGETEDGTYNVKLQADGTLGGLGCTVSGCYGSGDPATQISYNQYSNGPCGGDRGFARFPGLRWENPLV